MGGEAAWGYSSAAKRVPIIYIDGNQLLMARTRGTVYGFDTQGRAVPDGLMAEDTACGRGLAIRLKAQRRPRMEQASMS